MTDKNPKTLLQKLMDLTDILPECCTPFLLESGNERALSTRVRYAEELQRFFNWLIQNHPDFCDLDSPRAVTESLLSHISSQDISRYITRYKDEGHAERTTALKRNVLSSYFGYMVDNKRLEFSPVPAAAKIKIHESEDIIYLNLDEQMRLLDAVYTGTGLTPHQLKMSKYTRLRDVTMILLMLDTGLRVSEVCGTNIVDVNLEESSVYVTRKGEKTQIIYYSDETREKLEEYINSRKVSDPTLSPSDPLFVSIRNERLTTNGVWRFVKKYTDISFPGRKISPHKLRSSYAMELYRADNDILLVQRALGHKEIATTNKYAKATRKELQMARNTLSERRNSRISQNSEKV